MINTSAHSGTVANKDPADKYLFIFARVATQHPTRERVVHAKLSCIGIQLVRTHENLV